MASISEEVAKLFVSLGLSSTLAGDMSKEVGAAEKGAADIAKSYRGIGIAATAAGGAIVGSFALATNSLVSYEKGMAEVFTLMPNMTADMRTQMSADVRALAVEMGVLPEELVPALYQAISAGVPPDNVFDFLRTANAAAIGGVTDLETAVDGITSVVNAYGSDVLSAAEASDKLFIAVKLGKTNFEELSNYIYQVIPTASALGVEFGDVTAALAAMTAQGTPTRVAATQLRQLLVELSKDGGDTSETFKNLAGKSFKDFIAEGHNLQDALELMSKATVQTNVDVGEMGPQILKAKEDLAKYKDQLKIATLRQSEFTEKTAASTKEASKQKISNLTADIAELEKFLKTAAITSSTTTVGLNDLFSSVEAGNAALALTGKGTEAFSNALDEMETSVGATDKAFSTMDETTGRSLDKVLAMFEELKLEIGDVFLPILKDDILPALKTLLGVFSGMPDWMKPVILAVGALGAALMVLGPLLVALPTIITAVGVALTILSAHPIILVIGGLILLFYVLEDQFGLLSTAAKVLGGVFDWLSSGISALIDWLTNAVDWAGVLGVAFKVLLGPIGWIMLAMDALGISWDDVWDGMISIAQGAASFIGGIIDTMVGGIKWAVNAVIDGINIMIRGLNMLNFTVPDWVPLIGGESIGFNIQSIPRLAEGGIVTQPTIAMIGEAGPEAVVPLSGSGAAGVGGGVTISGNTFVVREDADIQKVAKELYTLIDRTNRGRGAGI